MSADVSIGWLVSFMPASQITAMCPIADRKVRHCNCRDRRGHLGTSNFRRLGWIMTMATIVQWNREDQCFGTLLVKAIQRGFIGTLGLGLSGYDNALTKLAQLLEDGRNRSKIAGPSTCF